MSSSLNLAGKFFHHAKSTPQHAAIGFSNRVHTYAELMARVQCIYAAIDNETAPLGERIGVLASPDLDTYAAILAILASGRAYVPVHPDHPAQRNSECLEQAQVDVVLQTTSTSKLQSLLREKNSTVQVIDTSQLPSADRFRDPASVTPDDLAYILFTSGSTGLPKGVPIYRRSLDAFFESFLSMPEFRFDATDRFLQMFDLTFDLSIMSMLTPLLIGASTYVPSAKGAGFVAVQRALATHEITVALMVPSVLTFLRKYFGEIHLPHLRHSLFCGEALPAETVTEWFACVPSARVFNVYGPTEATIFCTSYEVPREGPVLEHRGITCIGSPMPGTRLLVLDEKRDAVPDSEPGDLYLGGPQVTSAYWGNQELTRAAFMNFVDGDVEIPVYRTGDVAFQRDGNFYYCGRSDQQIKIAGYRVELGEIESQARKLPGTRAAVAAADLDRSGGTVLHLFLEANEPLGAEQLAECRRQLQDSLPHYMIPQKFHVLQSFPLNRNGKIDRKELLRRVTERDAI